MRQWGGVVVLAVLASSSHGPAQDPAISGLVTDEGGHPLSGAAVALHESGRVVFTNAQGRFSVPLERLEDVLTVTAPGRLPRSFAVMAADPERTLVLAPQDAQGPPGPIPRREVVFGPTGRAAGLLSGETESVPFRVGDGANGGWFTVDWADRSTRLMANVVHEGTGTTFGFIQGDPPLQGSLGSALLRDWPGRYRIDVVVFDGQALGTVATVEGEVSHGPWRAKVVEGKTPEVVAGTGFFNPFVPRNHNMDITAIWFTNETADQVDVVMELDQLTSTDSGGNLVEYWSVHWYNGTQHLALFMRGDRDGTGEEWTAARCEDQAGTCSSEYKLYGIVEPGRPGRVTWHVPKMAIGSPANDTFAERVSGRTFQLPPVWHNPLRRLPIPVNAPIALVADETMPDVSRPYVFGAEQYNLLPEAVIGRNASGPPLGLDLLGPAFWLPGVAGALLVAGGGAAWLTRRFTPRIGPGGRYHFVRLLGEGSFGRTSLARGRATGQLVAIKTCVGPTATPTSRARFLREARIGQSIVHAHVVRVLEVDDGTGTAGIVMEYVPGGSLEARLAEGGLPRAEALQIWRDILAGLDAIHAAGIVHRDVKPSNVLLTEDGRAKVADFGVARPVAEETLGPGGPVGTPLYMAPELLQGREPTFASDLYSATAVAYRMLTSRPHLDLAGADAWAALLERRGRRAALPESALPGWLNQLLAAGLAEDPRKRPAGAGEMLRVLEPHLTRPAKASPALRPP